MKKLVKNKVQEEEEEEQEEQEEEEKEEEEQEEEVENVTLKSAQMLHTGLHNNSIRCCCCTLFCLISDIICLRAFRYFYQVL